MACGVPCVVTDVGDAPVVVGDTGMVVPPGDPAALAGSLIRMIDGGRDRRMAMGLRARERIIDRYEISTVVSRYQGLYRAVSGRGRGGGPRGLLRPASTMRNRSITSCAPPDSRPVTPQDRSEGMSDVCAESSDT